MYGVDKNEVYMELSLGFETHDRQSHVYKALYKLKQVLRTWYGRFDRWTTTFATRLMMVMI